MDSEMNLYTFPTNVETPTITIPRLLDWFDSQIETFEHAKYGASPEVVRILDVQIATAQDFKEFMQNETLQAIDENRV